MLALQEIHVTFFPFYLSFVRRTEHSNYQGVSHAKWPKNKHESVPSPTGSVICRALEAADIEWPPP